MTPLRVALSANARSWLLSCASAARKLRSAATCFEAVESCSCSSNDHLMYTLISVLLTCETGSFAPSTALCGCMLC